MSDRIAFEYALVRIVPRIERGECLNAGVMLTSRSRRYLKAVVAVERVRLRAVAPFLEPHEIDQIQRQIDLIPPICRGEAEAGPIALLSLTERWHWLTAPSSTIVQPGPVHTGICDDPDALLIHLFATMVALPS